MLTEPFKDCFYDLKHCNSSGAKAYFNFPHGKVGWDRRMLTKEPIVSTYKSQFAPWLAGAVFSDGEFLETK